MTETKTLLGCGALIGALLFVLFWSDYHPVRRDAMCDIQTYNCVYERLATPAEGTK